MQKKKAEGPTDPQQPAKKHKGPEAVATPPAATPTPAMASAEGLSKEIEAQGSKVRELKSASADKVRVVTIRYRSCDV